MATQSEAQALVTAAQCNWCTIPAGLAPYVVLAVLILKGNGMSVPTDPNALIAQATCLRCIPEGLLPYAMLSVLSSGSFGGGSVTYGTANPVAAPPGNSGWYYRTDTGALWIWNSATSSWDAIIA